MILKVKITKQWYYEDDMNISITTYAESTKESFIEQLEREGFSKGKIGDSVYFKFLYTDCNICVEILDEIEIISAKKVMDIVSNFRGE